MTSKSEEKSSVEKSQENQSDESELDSGDEQFGRRSIKQHRGIYCKITVLVYN